MPEFSVLICTYNRPQLLARAIQSVLEQTHQDFELVVVDDHSCQDPIEVIEGFKDSRIRTFRQPENRGVACATNLGLQAAKGRYTVFLADDDHLLPNFLQKMSEHLRTTQAIFSWCGVLDGFEDEPEVYEKITRPIHCQQAGANKELVTKVGTGFGFTIVTERLRELSGLDTNLRSCVDTELFIRLVQQPWHWQSLPDCLVRVYRQRDRLTRPSDQRIRDLLYIMHKHRTYFAHEPELDLHFRLVVSAIFIELGQRRDARQSLMSLLKKYPGAVMGWLLLMANETGLGAQLLSHYRKLRVWLLGFARKS